MSIESVLYIAAINEAEDPRTYVGKTQYVGADKGPGGMVNKYDWRVWSGAGFGQRVASALSNMGKGYSVEVSDFGASVVVRVSYHNPATGKGIEKTYVVLFDDPKKADGVVFSTSTKWRTISNVDQAISYISSSIRSYATSV